MILSLLCVPLIKTHPNAELFNYIQAVSAYLTPPVCAVYVLAVFWQRTNEQVTDGVTDRMRIHSGCLLGFNDRPHHRSGSIHTGNCQWYRVVRSSRHKTGNID